MRYVFDLDGTLCTADSSDYMKAEPLLARIAVVNGLYEAGNFITIDTARGSGTGQLWALRTRQQIDGWGLKYHQLRVGHKLAADVYVDDRAVSDVRFFGESTV